MKRKQAFTLIELMVVVAIIGILASLGVASYVSAVRKARDTRQKSDVSNIQQALLLFRSDRGRYPAGLGELVAPPGHYMREVPSNPRAATDGDYTYWTDAVGNVFRICTGRLETNSGTHTHNDPNPANPAHRRCPTPNSNGCVFFCLFNP